MDENSPRPPYVQFEIRSVEDRTRSVEEGHYVPKDVIFAIVTAAGTRDRLEKDAEEWIKGLEELAKQERIPENWVWAFKDKLKNFKESREVPDEGTSVRNWAALSPAQVNLLLDLNIRTVEDVSEMTEEALSRLGMGAVALKARAKAWLDSSKDTGKVAAEVENLRQENIELKERNSSLEDRLKNLELLVQSLKPSTAPENNEHQPEEEAVSDEVDA